MKTVKITYHGHACFDMESEGYRIVVDPYQHGMVDGLPDLKLCANAVYCSHHHGDHDFVEVVSVIEADGSASCWVEEFDTPHDDQDGKLRGRNLVRIFHFGSLRIAHLGDLGQFPEEAVLNALRNVDCLLIPVGGVYTIDPEAAKVVADAIDPRVCIPMHYRTDTAGLGVLSHLNDFAKYYPEVQECDNSFLLNEETPKQILIINYKPEGE